MCSRTAGATCLRAHPVRRRCSESSGRHHLICGSAASKRSPHGFDGWPLAACRRRAKDEMFEVVDYTAPICRATGRVTYGRRHAGNLVNGVAAGIDMSTAEPTPTRQRHALHQPRQNLDQKRAFAADDSPLDPNCSCVACTTVSRAYLRHLYVNDEIAASVYNTIHNLSFYLDLMRSIRQAIASNSFWSFREAFLTRVVSGEAA